MLGNLLRGKSNLLSSCMTQAGKVSLQIDVDVKNGTKAGTDMNETEYQQVRSFFPLSIQYRVKYYVP